MSFRNYLYAKNSSTYLNEEFKTDEEGIKSMNGQRHMNARQEERELKVIGRSYSLRQNWVL